MIDDMSERECDELLEKFRKLLVDSEYKMNKADSYILGWSAINTIKAAAKRSK
jgi:hypothetical protein